VGPVIFEGDGADTSFERGQSRLITALLNQDLLRQKGINIITLCSMRPIPHQNPLFEPLNTSLKAGEFGLIDSWVLELLSRCHHLILWLGLSPLFLIYRG
jgi:hypothetical protein